ncbi:vesicle-associated membrane protein 1 isoform X2 [Notamacropus eugenii]|uniref:vesicle-associated membrane protein 1 isoform X2 n=1 Tax=Notamacropus eugenii TaxID=9315 RepID=UPI003B671590
MSAPAQPPTPGAPEGGAPGGGPPPNTTSNRRLQQTQAQVEEVVDIIRVNVDKVLERDQKLSELDDRADALQAGASQFESSAAKLKRKYWWKNCKMMIMLGAICAIIVVIIVIQYKPRRPSVVSTPSVFLVRSVFRRFLSLPCCCCCCCCCLQSGPGSASAAILFTTELIQQLGLGFPQPEKYTSFICVYKLSPPYWKGTHLSHQSAPSILCFSPQSSLALPYPR